MSMKSMTMSFQVVLQDGVFKVGGSDKAPSVDVDDRQRLGPVDHQVPPGRQIDLAIEGSAELVLNVVPLE
jgi:hypothetical protein